MEEIADLLEIKGESPFKVRAYRKGALALEHLREDAGTLYREKRLTQVPGIGDALAKKIGELVETGKLTYLERLRAEIPESLREMLALPGVGPRTIKTIYDHLHIKDLEALKRAAQEKQIRRLPGLGNKTEVNILRGIELLHGFRGKVLLGIGLPAAEDLVDSLRAVAGAGSIAIGGSIRRGAEMVGDIDLVGTAASPDEVLNTFCTHPLVKEVLERGPSLARVQTWVGLEADLWIVPEDEFIPTWFRVTGSKRHYQLLLAWARERGQGDLIRQNDEGREEFSGLDSEAAIYEALGLQCIPPELREARGEIEAASRGHLPRLLEEGDIRGDLHLHSRWSDGINGILELAQSARERGYQYLAVTDHSRSLGVAGGLSIEKWYQQKQEIGELNQELDGFHILHGIEVDILRDGQLDYPNAVLADADIVVASIHSGFQQDQASLTKRLQQAMENPHVDIIAHPTGRILGRRRAYDVDMDQVLAVAQETNTALEINSSPDRLDLNDEYVRAAKDLGIKIAINTDAHDAARLGDIRFGVITGRRGWLEKDQVINAWSLSELKVWLDAHKRS